jgi:hypothetical protein
MRYVLVTCYALFETALRKIRLQVLSRSLYVRKTTYTTSTIKVDHTRRRLVMVLALQLGHVQFLGAKP